MKKTYAAFLAIVILGSTAFAISETSEARLNPIKEKGKAILPYPYDIDTTIFKGIAVDSENRVVPSVFVATKKEPGVFQPLNEPIESRFKYINSFLIVGGNVYKLNLKNTEYDEQAKTLVLDFTSQDGNLKLVIKTHAIDYRNVVIASGVFNDYTLNMKLIDAEEPVYTIYETSAAQTETTPSMK